MTQRRKANEDSHYSYLPGDPHKSRKDDTELTYVTTDKLRWRYFATGFRSPGTIASPDFVSVFGSDQRSSESAAVTTQTSTHGH